MKRTPPHNFSFRFDPLKLSENEEKKYRQKKKNETKRNRKNEQRRKTPPTQPREAAQPEKAAQPQGPSGRARNGRPEPRDNKHSP